ncbi:MAG: chromosomal replication initiator protein DnaA [Anaerolineae bacterium]|nr:chromosomal replication initiator protein DnaA [Anaerolineae bacterium]
MENADKVWQAALGELELQMTRATFNTWLKSTKVVSWDDENFVLGVPNGYIKDWLENRLYTPIQRTVSGILARTIDVQFIVWPDEQDVEQDDDLPLLNKNLPPEPQATQSNGHYINGHSGNGNGYAFLNPRYTFDTFVVGSSNRLPHAAALAVANSPATAYNPLFLYGGVGLGKTHLLHAIGHSCQKRDLSVLYVSSEQFTNDMIYAIRTQDTEKFRVKYRNPDVLLIDDIQFIAGKESTQEEFFHTFNTLHAANKQIILTSDRPPKAIPTLEERLRSRFEWGLIADIQPPDLETRIAILQFKVSSQKYEISEQVINLIAQRIVSNIRELEGALNKVVAYAKLMNTSPTIDTLEIALRDLIAAPKTLTPDQVLGAVARFYQVSEQKVKGRKRNKDIVRPRQVAMYLMRKETSASLPEIGQVLGGRDHTTVIYGVEKIEGLLEQDNTLRREIMSIKEELYRKVS